MDKIDVAPQIIVGDKVVRVGPLNWAGIKALADAFAKSDLPVPNLQAEGIRQRVAALGGSGTTGSITPADVAGLAYEVVASNLPTFYQWAVRHPPLVAALVRGASNLTGEEVEQLSAGQTLRVARAAWQSLVSDGFFRELAGFFGELLGLPPTGTSAAPAAEQATAADSVSESSSPSAPPPAGN